MAPNCQYHDIYDPDTDLDGIAVAVANVVVSFCSRILVTFSPAAVDTGISASLIQTHSILLSVLLSTNRNQLSLGDVYYALTITSHPLIVYLTISSICDLFGMKTGLYEKIESHRRTIRALGVLILPLWLALSLTATLSPRAFKGSGCLDDSLKSWSRYYVIYYPVTLVAQGHGGRYIPVIFTSLFSLCLFRSRSQVMADFRACREGKSTLLWRMVLSIPWTFTKCAWRTINRNHKWWVYCLFVWCDYSWAAQIVANAVLAHFDAYTLSYGQLLSVFAAIPPLVPTAKLFYAHRWDLLHLFRRLPGLCLTEGKYLIFGIEPDPPVLGCSLPSNTNDIPYSDRPTLNVLRNQTIACLLLTHPASLLPELGSGMQPGGADGGGNTKPCASNATLQDNVYEEAYILSVAHGCFP